VAEGLALSATFNALLNTGNHLNAYPSSFFLLSSVFAMFGVV